MKKTLLIIMALAGLFLSASVSEVKAQTNYYYNDLGTKILLTLNEEMVCISIPIECSETIERIRANVDILFSKTDEFFDIYFITRADLEKLNTLDFWEEDAKSVIITPSFYIENDVLAKAYGAAFSTPYLGIKLKKEEDKDLLNSYIEKYNLQITMHRKSMPLWYFLSVTPESEASPLEIANEMFESGDFAVSIPDFAYAGYGGYAPNTVRSITTTQQPSPTYDLQGRKLSNSKWSNGQIRKGIYVKDGRKFVVK